MQRTGIHLNKKAKGQGFTAKFLCYRHKTLKGGRHPILLQLIHHGTVKRISTSEACIVEQWNAEAGRVRSGVRGAAVVNGVLSSIESKAVDIVDSLLVMGTLSLEAFEVRYRNPKASEDVLGYTLGIADELEQAGRVGNAAAYRNTARILRRFTGGKPLRFADLSASKLAKLEQHLREEGCTGGGVSVYMRTLRAVVGRAIKAGLMHRDHYPFETKMSAGYSLNGLKSENNPRALSDADMDKLKRFPFADHPHLSQSVRLFLFSYYARGMNFADIAQLKHTDLYDGRIVYRRQKTNKEFNILVSDALAEIIAAFDSKGGTHLFPILSEQHATDKQKWTRIQKCLKRLNLELKEAAEVAGVDVLLTSYVARHTFATKLKRSGVDVAVISESMGHESVNTTSAYLKRFGSDVLDKADQLL